MEKAKEIGGTMKITKRETAFEGEYLRLVRKTLSTNTDSEVIWETVERTNVYGKGAVVVVALTKHGELILERQWRAATESFVIEFPGGLTDRQGEDAEETARRELLEETGYVASTLIPIITAPTSPALTSLAASYYFAPEVEFVGNVRQDFIEEIEVLSLTISDLRAFLLNLPDDTELDLRVTGILWVLETKGLL